MGLKLKGKSTLRIWEPGFLPDLMSNGYTMKEAQELGLDAGMGVEVCTVENLITTEGLQLAGDILANDDDSWLAYHCIGTGTAIPLTGDTLLATEVSRKAWSSTVRSGQEVTFSAFYSAAQSTYAVEECGIFGGTTAGTALDSGRLFSHYLQSYDNSSGANDLTFDYALTVSTS